MFGPPQLRASQPVSGGTTKQGVGPSQGLPGHPPGSDVVGSLYPSGPREQYVSGSYPLHHPRQRSHWGEPTSRPGRVPCHTPDSRTKELRRRELNRDPLAAERPGVKGMDGDPIVDRGWGRPHPNSLPELVKPFSETPNSLPVHSKVRRRRATGVAPGRTL